MHEEVLNEVFSYVPIERLINNDACALQFVCKEFFVYIDKNILLSAKERVVEMLSLKETMR